MNPWASIDEIKKTYKHLSDYVGSLIEGADDADVFVFPPLHSICDWAKQLEDEHATLKRESERRRELLIQREMTWGNFTRRVARTAIDALLATRR